MNDDRLKCHACGQIHKNAQLVTLHDGAVVGNYSVEWMLECEAKMICKMQTLEKRRQYLNAVKEKRGIESWKALSDRVASIWKSSKPDAQPKVAENIGSDAVDTPAIAHHRQPGKTGVFQQVANRDLSFDF